MTTYKTGRYSVISFFSIMSLLFLTGCFGEKDEKKSSGADSHHVQESSEVLFYIDEKPVLTVAEYEEQKSMAQQANPQVNMILQMMPDAEYNILFKGMVTSRMMKEWGVRNKIDQDPEFIKQRKQLHDAMDLQLFMKYYDDAHPVHVSDEDAEKYYIEKRDSIPALKTSQGGVAIKSVVFDFKKAAQDFLEKVKDASNKKFEEIAKEGKLSVSSMTINQESHVSAPLKNRVLELKKFPHKELIKVSDKAYWVINAVKKEDAQYRPYNSPDVKQGIKKMMRDERKEKALLDNVEKLKKEYNTRENKEYFDKKTADRQKAVEQAQKVAAEAQEQAAKHEAAKATSKKPNQKAGDQKKAAKVAPSKV